MRPDPTDRLLARGALSAPERERILANVYRSAALRPRRYLLALLSLAPVGALLLFVHITGHQRSEFYAKGAGTTPVVDVECMPGSLAACPVGATLIFHSTGTSRGSLFLHAYAESVDRKTPRVWYWPGTAKGPVTLTGGASEPLRYAIRLGSEHIPGSYLIHLLWADLPLTRDQILGDTSLVRGTDIVRLNVVTP